MPSIQRLTRPKPRSVMVDLGDGDVLNISFDSNKLTPAWVNETQQQDVLAVARALAEVILEWDVVADEQGTPYPPTTENLAALSYVTQTQIATKLIEASAPSSAEGNELSEPRSTPPMDSTPPASTSLNGPATETSLTASESPSPT